jgi:hypothetical protein
MIFPINLGGTSINHEILDTSAPADYDSFGTFTICEGEVRTVAVRVEHRHWQTMRYSSGNHFARPTEHDRSHIVDVLWRRLQGWEK